jgi:predicted DCC family thiol-disulfide oxidoreductase YuxK
MRFEPLSRADRRAVFILLGGGAFVALSIVVFSWFLNPILTHLYGGALYSHLERLRRHHGPLDYGSFISNSRLLFSRLCLLAIFLGLALAAWVARKTVRNLVVNFFQAPASPINLALFRIAVFGVSLYFFSTDFAATLWFAGFPKSLQVAPYGVGWLLPHLPISPQLVSIASILFMTVCVAGVLGIFARTSALLASVLGFYVLGITQFFGKVSHDHEYIWFLALLAVSPCADALSVDAIFSARKRADWGSTELPSDSLVYSLPLRFASVLIGLIYFFPGFWKFWTCGFDWALSDNLKHQMYSKWTEFPGWVPFFRLDMHPVFYRSMALATLAIEMSFVFLIFFRRLRRVAALGAALFHVGSYFFLRIFFYDLIVFYIALFDTSGALRKVGGWFFKSPLIVFYDDDCSFCRRTIAAIRTIDVLGAIRYARARQDAELYLARLPGRNKAALLEDMHSVWNDRQFTGVETYGQIALRIPLLWPILPFLYVPTFHRRTARVYERVKHSRTCAIPNGAVVHAPQRSVRNIVAVGSVLLAGSLYAGARAIVAGWPFACFPTFAYIAQDHIQVLDIVAFDRDGRVMPTTDSASLHDTFADQRLRGLLESALYGPGENGERLRGVWQLYLQKAPGLEGASDVRFYRVTVSTIPGDHSAAARDLIAEMGSGGSIRVY